MGVWREGKAKQAVVERMSGSIRTSLGEVRPGRRAVDAFLMPFFYSREVKVRLSRMWVKSEREGGTTPPDEVAWHQMLRARQEGRSKWQHGKEGWKGAVSAESVKRIESGRRDPMAPLRKRKARWAECELTMSLFS